MEKKKLWEKQNTKLVSNPPKAMIRTQNMNINHKEKKNERD